MGCHALPLSPIFAVGHVRQSDFRISKLHAAYGALSERPWLTARELQQ